MGSIAQTALTKMASLTKADVEDRKNDAYGAAEKALREFNESPSKKTLAALAEAIEKADAMHPVHLQGGLYSSTRDTASRAREMMGRGNYLRGLLGWGLGVPVAAVTDTFKIPATTAARSLSPTINTRFTAPDEVKDLEVGDRSGIKSTARELLDLISEDRADPTSYFENVNNLKKRLRANTAQTVGGLVDEKKKADEEGKEYGMFSPYSAALTQDIISLPHTALLNLIGLNGARRYKYEGRKQDEYLNKEAGLPVRPVAQAVGRALGRGATRGAAAVARKPGPIATAASRAALPAARQPLAAAAPASKKVLTPKMEVPAPHPPVKLPLRESVRMVREELGKPLKYTGWGLAGLGTGAAGYEALGQTHEPEAYRAAGKAVNEGAPVAGQLGGSLLTRLFGGDTPGVREAYNKFEAAADKYVDPIQQNVLKWKDDMVSKFKASPLKFTADEATEAAKLEAKRRVRPITKLIRKGDKRQQQLADQQRKHHENQAQGVEEPDRWENLKAFLSGIGGAVPNLDNIKSPEGQVAAQKYKEMKMLNDLRKGVNTARSEVAKLKQTANDKRKELGITDEDIETGKQAVTTAGAAIRDLRGQDLSTPGGKVNAGKAATSDAKKVQDVVEQMRQENPTAAQRLLDTFKND